MLLACLAAALVLLICGTAILTFCKDIQATNVK